MIITDLIDDNDFQIFRIPKGYKINDTKIYLKKIGNSLFITPYHNPWQTFFDSLDKFTDDFMDERHQPEQKRESFD